MERGILASFIGFWMARRFEGDHVFRFILLLKSGTLLPKLVRVNVSFCNFERLMAMVIAAGNRGSGKRRATDKDSTLNMFALNRLLVLMLILRWRPRILGWGLGIIYRIGICTRKHKERKKCRFKETGRGNQQS